MSKPSLHELISTMIYWYISGLSVDLEKTDCDELAEQIIKIVRDYHLVEDSNDNTL